MSWQLAVVVVVLLAGCARHVSFAEYEASRPDDPHEWFRQRLAQRKSTSPLAFASSPGRSAMVACSKAYVVAVAEDGTVEFWGDANTRETGYSSWSMPPERVRKLEKAAVDRGVLGLTVVPCRSWSCIIDAKPACLFVAGREAEPLVCYKGRRETRVLAEFSRFIDFVSNAVQRIGEQGECSRPWFENVVVVDPAK